MRTSLNGEWCLLTAEQFFLSYITVVSIVTKTVVLVCMGRENTCKFIIPIKVPMKFRKKKKALEEYSK